MEEENVIIDQEVARARPKKSKLPPPRPFTPERCESALGQVLENEVAKAPPIVIEMVDHFETKNTKQVQQQGSQSERKSRTYNPVKTQRPSQSEHRRSSDGLTTDGVKKALALLKQYERPSTGTDEGDEPRPWDEDVGWLSIQSLVEKNVAEPGTEKQKEPRPSITLDQLKQDQASTKQHGSNASLNLSCPSVTLDQLKQDQASTKQNESSASSGKPKARRKGLRRRHSKAAEAQLEQTQVPSVLNDEQKESLKKISGKPKARRNAIPRGSSRAPDVLVNQKRNDVPSKVSDTPESSSFRRSTHIPLGSSRAPEVLAQLEPSKGSKNTKMTPWDRVEEEYRVFLERAGYSADDFNTPSFNRVDTYMAFTTFKEQQHPMKHYTDEDIASDPWEDEHSASEQEPQKVEVELPSKKAAEDLKSFRKKMQRSFPSKKASASSKAATNEFEGSDPSLPMSGFPFDEESSEGYETSTTDLSLASSYFNSQNFTYEGYGTGLAPGKKRRKSRMQLKEMTPAECMVLGGGKWYERIYWFLRLLFTSVLGLGVFGAMIFSYVVGLSFLSDDKGRFVFGLYGTILLAFMVVQSAFAALEHRRSRASNPPEDYEEAALSRIALQISAYQEDPDYFRECLKGCMQLKYPRNKLKIVCCIDGNDDDSLYMAEIFQQVVSEFGENPVLFRWDYNFHELPEDATNSSNGFHSIMECVQNHQFVCIMQRWGGKREVMYTAFKTLSGNVDYIQVCDSDTKLDPMAMLELAWVLDSEPKTGAVGGDVLIWNEGDSFISFLSSLRYWSAFNMERAAQSYFGCVSCISGPIGLYRMSIVDRVVDLWSDQKFLGGYCTFGDDRHLTNRILQMGYATKYCPRSICKTETPASYLRWLSQQIRWTKSYFREWLFNALWWHKHSIWMACEMTMAGIFPFFVMYTIVSVAWSGNLWGLMYLLMIIQAAGLARGLFACLVRGRIVMIFMSLYSCLYVTSLLPAKLFALLTIRKKGWGTSGRKTMLTTYNALIPVVVWAVVVVGGVIYSSVLNDYSKDGELFYLCTGSGAYAFYWMVMFFLWKLLVQRHHMTKKGISEASQGSSSQASSQGSTITGYPKPMDSDIEEGSMSNGLSSMSSSNDEKHPFLRTSYREGCTITKFESLLNASSRSL